MICTPTPTSVLAHRIEILYPHSIYRPIKDQPLHAVAVICHGLPNQLGRQAILPVIADWIVGAVQLPQADAPGIEAEGGDALVCWDLWVRLVEQVQGVTQALVAL